jgi:hypothetical protein
VRRVRRIAIAAALLTAAALVGIAAQLGDAAPGVPSRATALGAPWLVAAFATGALLRGAPAAALGGAVLLAGGTVAYYATQLALTGHVRALSVGGIALGWALAGLAAGAAMGALGAMWRTATRVPALLAAVPAAALVGEAVLLAGEWERRRLLAAELLLGAVLLPLCARRRASLPAATLAACALAVAFAGAEAEVREAMRAAGWRGA